MMDDSHLLKVFYSWQSDLPRKTHHDFIRGVLTAAIENLNQEDVEIEEAGREEEAALRDDFQVVLDHDLKNVPGTPDVANTILEKIRNCHVFVADVSFVAKGTDSKGRERYLPNSNVMVELGYAMSSVGSDCILLIMDTAQGPVEQRPFDFKHMRFPITYCSTNDLKSESKTLQGTIEEALRTFLEFHSGREKPVPLHDDPNWDAIISTISSSDSRDEWHSIALGEDKQISYYLEDVNLRFEWKFSSREPFKTEWTDKFPTQSAASYEFLLFYGSTVIDSIKLVAVDGSSVFLPMPDPKTLSVNPFDYKVASIFDYRGKLQTYIKAAGLKRTWMTSD